MGETTGIKWTDTERALVVQALREKAEGDRHAYEEAPYLPALRWQAETAERLAKEIEEARHE